MYGFVCKSNANPEVTQAAFSSPEFHGRLDCLQYLSGQSSGRANFAVDQPGESNASGRGAEEEAILVHYSDKFMRGVVKFLIVLLRSLLCFCTALLF